MKVFKGLSLDLEIVQKLQKDRNASGLVNEILKKYYAEQEIHKRAEQGIQNPEQTKE